MGLFGENTEIKIEETKNEKQEKIIELFVPGAPIPKQSDRNMVQRQSNGDVFTYTNRKTGKLDVIQRHYQPAKIKNEQKRIANYIMEHLKIGFIPMEEYAIFDYCYFIFPALSNTPKYKKEIMAKDPFNEMFLKTTTPDLDNLFKMLKDSIKGLILKDDNIICGYKEAWKYYGLETGYKFKIRGK